MTTCADTKLLMHGLLDNELDAGHAALCEEHLASCPDCARDYAGYVSLRQAMRTSDLRMRAPDALRTRIIAVLEAEEPRMRDVPRSRPWSRLATNWRHWAGALSALAVAASLALFITAPLHAPGVTDELVSSHVRSLLVSHLTDVPASDQHVVKPWFAGKLDFSPPVPDLTSAGFTLVGGRLDYVSGKVVAALVFKRREHVVNVFVWPDAGALLRPAEMTFEGYNLVNWSDGGMTFWGVSDLNMRELRDLAKQFQMHIRVPS